MALSRFTSTLSCIVLLLICTDNFAQSTAQAVLTARVTEVVGTRVTKINSSNSQLLSNFGTTKFREGSNSSSPRIAESLSVTLIGNNSTYAFTLPSSVILKRNGGTETIEADEFTISSSVCGEDRQTILFEVLFKIAGSQVAGLYNSVSPFPVTVHYN